MLEIYFDGVLLDSDKYLSLTQKGKMFDKEFKLGGVMSREFKLTIPKADFNTNTKRVLIKYMSNDYAHLIIDKYTFNEGGIPTVDLTLVDKLVLADFNYDASGIVPTTTLGILQDICNKMGVVLGNTDFPNNDVAVNFYDTTLTARQYISYIAEVSGGFARIEADGKLYIRGFSNKDASQGIVPELCEQILIGSKHKIERVVYDNGLNKMEKILDGVKKTSIGNNKFDYVNSQMIAGVDSKHINVERINNGIKMTSLTANQWAFKCFVVGEVEELLGETINVLCDVVLSHPNNKTSFALVYCDETGGNRETIDGTTQIKDGKLIGQWNKIESGANRKYVALRMYVNTADTFAVGDFVEYNNIMVSTFKTTSYEPYTTQNEYLETLYISGDNVYVQDEEVFGKIADKILGFEYYDIDTGKTYILPNTMSGDVLKLTYENQEYHTIEQFEEISFLGTWQGSYKLQIDSGLQQETKVAGINTQMKAIKVNLNRNNNTLQIVVSDVETQKTTTNNLFVEIQANQSLMEQTAKEINQSVIQLEGKLSEDINGVADNLSNINTELQNQIILQQSLIQQLAESITSTIKSTGGNNLLRNSVGLAGLDFWEVEGNVTTNQDSYVEQNSLSGSKIVLDGVSSVKQSYVTQPGITYGISFKLRHLINGTANPIYIRVYENDNYIDLLMDNQITNEYTSFEEFNDFTYIASENNPRIEIINTGDDVLEITDLIISIGENQTWSSYFDEVYGKEHRLDKYGLKLSDLTTGDYSKHTTNALQFIDDEQVVAEVSKTQVKSNAGNFTNEIKVRKLQWIALDDDNIIEYIE